MNPETTAPESSAKPKRKYTRKVATEVPEYAKWLQLNNERCGKLLKAVQTLTNINASLPYLAEIIKEHQSCPLQDTRIPSYTNNIIMRLNETQEKIANFLQAVPSSATTVMKRTREPSPTPTENTMVEEELKPAKKMQEDPAPPVSMGGSMVGVHPFATTMQPPSNPANLPPTVYQHTVSDEAKLQRDRRLAQFRKMLSQ